MDGRTGIEVDAAVWLCVCVIVGLETWVSGDEIGMVG